MPIACPDWEARRDTTKLPKLHLYQITNQLSTKSDSLNQLRVATHEGDEFILLKHTITQGCPSNIKEVSNVLQAYWTFREELTVDDGLTLKGTRIVIPSKKHEAILKLIHKGHLGLNKCKLQTKDTVYRLGLNYQLGKLISDCKPCLKYSQSKCKQQPIMALGQETFFHFEGASCLPIVDYTNRFPVVHKLLSMTGQHVSTQCKQIFSEYGWSETLISDNGPCYSVEGFTNLMKEYGVNHITSSPHYPQSNGLAKKLVQIVKNVFYKAKEEGRDMFKC